MRPAGPGDDAFLRSLDAAVRAYELGPGLDPDLLVDVLALQYRAREAAWERDAPGRDDLVVLWDEAPSGRLVLDRAAGGIRVVDIAVLPDRQGRGIGTAAMGEVIEEADLAGLPVSLHVVVGSRAVALYERLGFRRAGSGETHLFMERPSTHPAGAQRGSHGPTRRGVRDG